ncbi:MAG: hypothetical protein CVU29_00295 [Betaproteobacteria bacterium HGW-Betaproteobacteria-22]|nr:MAG: hypothetical protein CVU29_00295 [Betaproteobacteria bacterium HGW-Betaproteobacteria-22]
MMTREDLLRELELLPVWSLRALLPEPVSDARPFTPIQPAVQTAQSVLTDAAVVNDVVPTNALSVDLVAAPAVEDEAMPQALVTLRLLTSDIEEVAFLLSESLTDAESMAVETLLQNMLKAMKVVCRHDVRNVNLQQLQENACKVIIVMGEAAANALLNQSMTLEDWRNAQKQQSLTYQGTPVVMTYHPLHLLQNPLDKAGAWADLCRAKEILQNV